MVDNSNGENVKVYRMIKIGAWYNSAFIRGFFTYMKTGGPQRVPKRLPYKAQKSSKSWTPGLLGLFTYDNSTINQNQW